MPHSFFRLDTLDIALSKTLCDSCASVSQAVSPLLLLANQHTLMRNGGGGNLLNGLYRTISHCLSPDMAHASGSQALLSVLDGQDSAAPSNNGGTPMHTENGDHKPEEDFYGEAARRCHMLH